MERKNKNDYTAAEERFAEKYKEVLKADDERIAEAKRPVDYSFLDVVPARKPMNHATRFLKVACVLLGIFVMGSGLAVWINSEPANAGRFTIEKTFHELKAILSGESGTGSGCENENLITYEIDDFDKVEKIKKSIPALCIPQYIPDGYKLKELTASKDSNERFMASYRFVKGETAFWINEYDEEGDDLSELLVGGEIVESDGVQLYIWKDEFTEQWTVNRLWKNVMIVVFGNISKDELIQVAIGVQ